MSEREAKSAPGKYQNIASKHLGGLLYLSSGSRLELSFAVGFLGRYVTKWEVWNDEMLVHLFGYLSSHVDEKLNLFVAGDKMEDLSLEALVDSDHAGDPCSARSTSGAVIRVIGPKGTKATIAVQSKRQGATAQSTGEAEIVAVADGMRRMLLPVLMVFEFIFGSPPKSTSLLSDSTAAIGAVQNGYGVMKYVKKTQRVSMGWISDVLEQKEISLGKVDGEDNTSDAMTKHLQCPRFVRLSLDLGVG